MPEPPRHSADTLKQDIKKAEINWIPGIGRMAKDIPD